MQMELTPDLIPHENFHNGTWLLPVRNGGWYYFWKKKSRNNIKNPDFLDSVDAPLKKLIDFLHEQGVKTTPSCSGHHKSKMFFEKIYDELQENENKIRKHGLKFKDIESGRVYTYRDELYSLPWSREIYLNRVLTSRKAGWLA